MGALPLEVVAPDELEPVSLEEDAALFELDAAAGAEVELFTAVDLGAPDEVLGDVLGIMDAELALPLWKIWVVLVASKIPTTTAAANKPAANKGRGLDSLLVRETRFCFRAMFLFYNVLFPL